MIADHQRKTLAAENIRRERSQSHPASCRVLTSCQATLAGLKLNREPPIDRLSLSCGPCLDPIRDELGEPVDDRQ